MAFGDTNISPPEGAGGGKSLEGKGKLLEGSGRKTSSKYLMKKSKVKIIRSRRSVLRGNTCPAFRYIFPDPSGSRKDAAAIGAILKTAVGSNDLANIWFTFLFI